MKKILIIFLLLSIMFTVAAVTYTEEEFNEVYNALVKSTDTLNMQTELIKQQNEVIKTLRADVQTLTQQLDTATAILQNTSSLLDMAQAKIEDSNKLINSLNNQKFLAGAHAMLKMQDFKSKPDFGVDINLGYKILIGYLTFNVNYFFDKSFALGLGYNIVL